MALAIHSSSPAPIVGSGTTNVSTLTTASFTPPVGAILAVMFANGSSGGANGAASSVTDNLGTHLTYTQQKLANQTNLGGPCNASVWTSTAVVTSTAMTVTVNISPQDTPNSMILGVIVFTGAASSQAGKAVSNTGTTGVPTCTLPAGTSSTSWMIAATASGSSNITPTFAAGQTDVFNSNTYLQTNSSDNSWCQGNNAVGNSNLTLTISNATNTIWAMAGYEVQSASAPAPVIATPIISSQAMKRASYF